MKRLCLVLLFSSLAFGQGALVAPQQVLTVINGLTLPVPSATITVCAANVSGIPCAPALVGALFKDAALTQPRPNPFTADGNGNYQFAIAPGQYTVTTTGSGFAGFSYQVSVSCQPISTCTYTATQSFNSPIALNGGGSLVGTFSGNPTFSGSVSAKTFQGSRQMCDQYAGATFDAKVNACIAAVIAQGGGIADATGLIGTQTQTAEIDVGTSTVSGLTNNQISVTLLLSPFLVDSLNFNSPASCGFKIFGESRIIGTTFGTTHSAQILGTATSNMSAALCTGGTGGQYVTVQGLQFYNPAGVGTFTNGLVYALNLIDTSSYSDLQISNQGGIGLHIRASCCQTVFRNIITDGNSGAGARPLVIESLSGDIGPINGIQLIGMSVDHAGSGLNEISIQHTFASNLNACSLTFHGLYIESNNTDVASNLINIDSCQTVNMSGFTAQFRAVSGTLTGVAIHIVNTSVPAVNTNLTLNGFAYQNSGLMTCPYTVVSENYGGFLTPTEANCTLPFFGSGDGYVIGDLLQANRNVDFAESNNGAVARANHDVCTGSFASHAILCSYNNDTAIPLPRVVASGTATMTTAPITAPACGTTVTVAAAGVATTDTITWSFNAAPAGTNAGIVAWPTSGNVNFAYCPGVTETPAAATINWRVMR